jgi:hypothetical protein
MRTLLGVSLLLFLCSFVWAVVGMPDGRVLFSSAILSTLALVRLR